MEGDDEWVCGCDERNVGGRGDVGGMMGGDMGGMMDGMGMDTLAGLDELSED